jgi:hypothetical protein
MDYTLDVGPRLQSVGLLAVIGKWFLIPVLIILLLVAAYFIIKSLWPKPYSPFDPIREPQTVNKSWILIGVCVATILIAVLLT